MSDLTQLIKNIENWAEARNLIEGSTPKKQFIKLMEEFGELCSGVSKNKIDVVKDSIGDCFVVLTIISAQRNRNEINIGSMAVEHHPKTTLTADDCVIELLHDLTRISCELDRNTSLEMLFGNIVLDLVEVCDCFELDLTDCVQAAWDEIKDRKGRMIDGVFVKEGDLTRISSELSRKGRIIDGVFVEEGDL